MLREVTEKVIVNKEVEFEDIGVREEIIFANNHFSEKYMEIFTKLFNEQDEMIKEETLIIQWDNYDLLFSVSDFFDTGKQKGAYREKDLWKVIDKVREESSLNEI